MPLKSHVTWLTYLVESLVVDFHPKKIFFNLSHVLTLTNHMYLVLKSQTTCLALIGISFSSWFLNYMWFFFSLQSNIFLWFALSNAFGIHTWAYIFKFDRRSHASHVLVLKIHSLLGLNKYILYKLFLTCDSHSCLNQKCFYELKLLKSL